MVLSVVDPAAVMSDRSAERFDDLFRRLYPRLVPLAARLLADRAEAEDVVQEAFLRLARTAQQTAGSAHDRPSDEAHPMLEEPRGSLLERPDEVVSAWLRRVVLNLGANRLRDRRRAEARLARASQGVPALDPERGPMDDGGPATALLRAEARAEVRATLAALSERQRDCLILRHAGYSYAEIAATVGIAPGSVGVYLARAERAFRAIYRPDDRRPPLDTERGSTR